MLPTSVRDTSIRDVPINTKVILKTIQKEDETKSALNHADTI